MLTDASNLSMATYVRINAADSTTDWRFAALVKQYNASPVQRTAFVGATLGGAIALSHYVPKAQKWVRVGLVVGT